MTQTQKSLLHELLARLNHRRSQRGRDPITAKALPKRPKSLHEYYLVDTYQVRRHFRRRPVWNTAAIVTGGGK